MKFLPIILSGLIGLAGGFLAGRSFAPAPARATVPNRIEERVTIISGGQESSPATPTQAHEPKAGKPEPLTMQGLRAELTAMESGGMFGMSVMRKWADLQERLKVSDIAALAAAWLDRQPTGPTKDAALRTLSRKIAQEDPEASLTWARGISEEKDRIRQTESIARDWLRQDPNSERSWIFTLPEETRKRLLK